MTGHVIVSRSPLDQEVKQQTFVDLSSKFVWIGIGQCSAFFLGRCVVVSCATTVAPCQTGKHLLLPNIRPLLWEGVRGEFVASLDQTETALGTSWAFQPAPAQVEALA